MAKQSNKLSFYFSIILILASCVIAFSSIIPNDYLKLLLVLGALGYGLYGIMKRLSTVPEEETEAVRNDKN